MARFWALLAAFVLVCPNVQAGQLDTGSRTANPADPRHHPNVARTWTLVQVETPTLVRIPNVQFSAYRTEAPRSSAETPTSAVLWISRVAARHGDRQFIVIDKVHGQLVLFQNGSPVFTGPALTGLSLADQLPADALGKSYAQQVGEKYRVTPAGRFTLSPGWDPSYGLTLDINEIQGSDWAIAIHQVPMGPRSGYREARLRSPYDQDKHVTEGCVNVDASTMRQLARFLPKQGGTPIYILPNDESLIARLFL